MNRLMKVTLAAVWFLASCGPPGSSAQPFFQLDVTYKLEDSTCTTVESCSAIKATNIVASLFEEDNNSPFQVGMAKSCGLGLVPGDGGTMHPDAGLANFIEITGYGGKTYDLYVQAFDSTGKLVAFGKAPSAVPANVQDNSVLPVMLVLSQPLVALCGDGNASEPGKTCDDFGNNACSNCGAMCPSTKPNCNVCPF